jgi:hypothetical protein
VRVFRHRSYTFLARAATAALVPPVACSMCWHPAPTTHAWQYQLQGKIDTSVPAHVYDVDGADVSRKTVRKLHDLGRRVVCYVDVGTWEKWRSDAGRFPSDTLGRPVEGWPGERWLDVRRRGELAPILKARLRTCMDKGFDAVDPDNVNGYVNSTGFPLTASDQLSFDTWVANAAHSLGLAVGLKNDLDQAPRLLPYFDFAVLEQCFQYSECRKASPFVRAGKTVVDVEYALPRDRFCERARKLHLAAMRKRLSLGAWRRPCG